MFSFSLSPLHPYAQPSPLHSFSLSQIFFLAACAVFGRCRWPELPHVRLGLCSSSTFKFTIRSSQSDDPLRRPVAPAPVKPSPSSSPPAAESGGDGGRFGEQISNGSFEDSQSILHKGMDYADPRKKTGVCGKIIMVSALTAFHVSVGYMSQSTVNSVFKKDDISKVVDDGRASIMKIEENARKKEEEREEG
ncbi:hypothetical protein BUALT_Bualt06G0053300 [Buddleja alternifolia]|uniref:Uncharacterized protein n=1 Tax=Buddleja alternifolia TaxID=168488 RepID=A0AAV6XKU8_9LAMI|nr:hypothetical protein BUALT_Bualt06G0053300 [Buddleja alternifolia]